MKAYAAGKLFWNTFKCESVLLRERCCRQQDQTRMRKVKGGHEG